MLSYHAELELLLLNWLISVEVVFVLIPFAILRLKGVNGLRAELV